MPLELNNGPKRGTAGMSRYVARAFISPSQFALLHTGGIGPKADASDGLCIGDQQDKAMLERLNKTAHGPSRRTTSIDNSTEWC